MFAFSNPGFSSPFASTIIAYIDMGTGSMVIQAVIAGLVGIAVAFRRVRFMASMALRRLMGKPALVESDVESQVVADASSTPPSN